MSNVSSAKARRTASRLAAAQTLYQLELGDVHSVREAIYDLMQLRQDDLPETLVDPDPELLQAICEGAHARLPEIDQIAEAALAGSRSLARTEPLLRAIYRACISELLIDGETAAGILINDYVNVAKAFCTEGEHKKVNAVLDTVARQLGRK